MNPTLISVIIDVIVELTTAFCRFHIPFAFHLYSNRSKSMERFFEIFMAKGSHPRKSCTPKATLSIPHGPTGRNLTPLPPEKYYTIVAHFSTNQRKYYIQNVSET